MAKKLIKRAPKDSVETFVARRLNNDSMRVVIVEKGLWRKGDNSVVDYYAFKDQDTLVNDFTDYPFMFVSGKMLTKGPEEYKDVRGSVIAEYQTYLEQLWIKELESKYPIVINQEVFESIFKP